MKKQRTYLLVIIVAILTIFQCKQYEKEEHHSSLDLLDLKEYPNDLFSFQRSYPFNKFSIKAYQQGLKESINFKNTKNASPGFDALWTNRGPGNAGGRVNTIATHPTDINTTYLGFSTGGVWKTTNGGVDWLPIFDDQPFLAIGDITLDPSNSETVYVGTGDPNITGYPAIGDGVYKSTDGGNTWTHLGLESQRIVSKIIVHPTNSDIVYVSCMGLPFERNDDRGLYKSIDGGANWDEILFVSDQSGIIDMVINTENPEILYAASWDRIRNNTESFVSGPNAKIHKTTDGGSTWTVLTNGLPSGNQGRIGLAIAETDPDILATVYVGTDSRLEGIFRTEDAGASWTQLPTSSSSGMGSAPLGGFGWYFGQIRFHPTNDQLIYLLGVSSWFTNNNGTFWSQLHNGSNLTPHVDYHDLVFNFQNDMLVGNDGGAYKRNNASLQFVDIENIPTNQVYRVAYDPHRTDSYFGGLQDNGSQTSDGGGMNDWNKLLGGDGFQMRFNPVDSNIVYAETQRGNIFRSSNGLSGFISSTIGINPDDRRNWDMQYFISPHNPDRLYTGTYRVYKSETSSTPMWDEISGDLTDGIIFGSPFHTITTLTESPIIEDLLYVGTTDGNVWRTDDGGTNWDSLHTDLPDRYITSVQASPDEADHVYVCVSGYRYNEFTPRVFKSTDRGDNWISIAGDLPDLAINDILVLPNQGEQILFVATDGGVYASTNGGINWEFLGLNLPVVTTYDLEWNEANNEVVAGTFGRSIYSYPIDSLLNNLDPTFNISGQIINEEGEGIDSINVEVTGDLNAMVNTDANGDFQLTSLSTGSNCEIFPTKDINIRNGFSTFDLVQMRAHLLFIDTLDSPYKIISGDLNNDDNLSTFDILIGRKVLLFIQDTFLNVPSWRFIPEDYEFTNPFLPFDDDFPESITCEDVENGGSANFIGFKIGDVSGNANPLMFGETAEGRYDETLEWYADDMILEGGKNYKIPLFLKQEEALIGFQLGLQFNAPIKFLDLESNGAFQLEESNYAFNKEANTLSVSWDNPYSTIFKKDRIAMYMNIKVLNDIVLSDLVAFESKKISSEAYNKSKVIFESKLTFKDQNTFIQNNIIVHPNPFKETCEIQFLSEQDETASLDIYDLNGRLVHRYSRISSKGWNTFQLTSKELKEPGLYIYQLKTKNTNHSGKIMKY